MITLRLSDDLEKQIENAAKSSGITKSELVRKSLIQYLSKGQNKSAWELGQHLFGRYQSGTNDLSTSSRAVFRERLKKKLGR